MLLLATLALLAQPAPTPASPPPNNGEVTVIERPEEESGDVPINSRIARPTNDAFAADPVAAMYLREWSNCIVMMHRDRSLALLASPLNSPEQAEIIDRITGRRFRQRTPCARFRTMRVDNLVLRGAIAEALYRWEERRRRSAGALAVPPLPDAANGPPAALAQMGRCVAAAEPEAMTRLMETRAGTGEATQALANLEERINECLPGNFRATNFHSLTLRGALGEPFYLSRRVPQAPPLSSADAAPPRS